ncbi:hypothetical protein [Rubripirellula reticaptiva]|uniref:Uncharacterized protein n=1 Tax=Rubripirellula reticaptiva TaxID=2528013 RepID=A0A5C6EES1_9BACT|nr:hypothetical protein [Rubripirellula reticaptiva]TWU46487.1 hypothetical protein Poly59_54300 [Rubripirellula reticaptiva]
MRYSQTYNSIALATLASILLVGCGRDDVASEASVQRIDKRLDALLGDMEASRQSIVRLQKQTQNAAISQLDQLVQQRDELRNSLPVLAGIELSDELAALDWLLAARQSISLEPTAVSLLDAEALLDAIPPSLEQIAPKLATEHATQCIQLAKTSSEAEIVDADSLDIIQGLLGRLQRQDDSPDEEVTMIMQDLQAKSKALANLQLAEGLRTEAKALQTQLENISSVDDAELRRSALVGLSQTVDSIRVRFVMEKMQGPEAAFASLRSKIDDHLTESLETLGKEQGRRVNKARMKYQAWALGQIQTLNQMFESEGWFENNYQKKHDAAVKHLLPINQGLLEPPVAKFYSEAFETIWQQIEDGEGMQLSLARKTAEVPKRTLESFMEHSK